MIGGLRLMLRVPPLRRLVERLACLGGRWAPRAWWTRALIFHVRTELLKFDAGRIRFASVPGGARIAVTLDEGLWQMLYFNGRYEIETTRFVSKFLRPGDVFVDVGANVGYYTMMAARAVGPTGRVYAFEPNPEVARLLRLSAGRASAAERIAIETSALGAMKGTATLHMPDADWNTGEASLFSYGTNRRGRQLRVPIRTLDEFCATNDVERIRLMKIDVEGAELEVLTGARRVLERIRPEAIICEFVPARRPQAQQAVLNMLRGFRYRPFVIEADGSLSPHEGFLPNWEWGNLCFTAVAMAGRACAS